MNEPVLYCSKRPAHDIIDAINDGSIEVPEE
jgi:hypothetical protein